MTASDKQISRTVLITGAAGGLGKALAVEFLSSGWEVIATDIDLSGLTDLKDQAGCLCLAMDITSDQSVISAVNSLSASGTVIDLIINNAGIDRYFPLSGTPVDRFRQVFEVNVFGAYRVNQAFLPLVRRPGGRIIHISSESLKLTLPFMPYPLSKQLLESYAKALRIELKFLGIDVLIVRPGAIRTPLLGVVTGLGGRGIDSPLEAQFNRFASEAGKEIGRVITPGAAAAFVRKVAGIPHPSAVYRINNMLQLRIAALLPFRIFERIVYRKLS